MYLILILRFILLFITILGIFVKHLAFLRTTILAYGKLTQTIERPTSAITTWLASLTVPKQWFIHFYLSGLALVFVIDYELYSLLEYGRRGVLLGLLREWDTPVMGDGQPVEECIWGLALATAQLMRRFYECLFVERPSPMARIHFGHYALGLVYYVIVVLGSWVEGAANLGVWSNEKPLLPASRSFLQPHHLITLGFFVYASFHQYRCHAILASLRSSGSKDPAVRYSIPRGGWFERVVAPHYLCEMMIYFSFCILTRFRNWTLILVFVWTVVNLSIVASETETWYRQTFGDKYERVFPKGRWLVLPWVY